MHFTLQNYDTFDVLVNIEKDEKAGDDDEEDE